MPNRTLVWTLAAAAVVLVLVPVLGMIGMIGMHWMTGGMMMGMSVIGTLWLVAAIFAFAVLMVLSARTTSRIP
jgi:hypothetical protein